MNDLIIFKTNIHYFTGIISVSSIVTHTNEKKRKIKQLECLKFNYPYKLLSYEINREKEFVYFRYIDLLNFETYRLECSFFVIIKIFVLK